MSSVRLQIATLLAAGVVVAACGSTGGEVRRPATAATPDARAEAARCQQLATQGVTPCPPARLALERISIRNDTHGAVSDAVARAEGLAYLRAHALYDWAVRQADGDAFLLSGAIVDPATARTNIFRDEVQVYADARAAGGRARIDPPTTTQVTLVPVPQAIQQVARQDGMQPSQYAWVDNQAGPARAWIELPGGGTKDLLRIDAGPHPILVFGQVKDDAELGSIWYLGGEFGCLADARVRAICGL